MTVSIGDYTLCNGTLSGGVAISDLGVDTTRIVDTGLPIGSPTPEFFDRKVQTFEVVFIVKRTHESNGLAERFILELDSNIPDVGTITFTSTGPSPFTRVYANGKLLAHALVQHIGATTFHRYRIFGGPPS